MWQVWISLAFIIGISYLGVGIIKHTEHWAWIVTVFWLWILGIPLAFGYMIKALEKL